MEVRAAAGGPAPPQKVRLLYTNDVHGYISPVQDRVVLGQKAQVGGSAYLATLVAQARAQDPGRVLLLDSGDSVHGSLTTDLDQGNSMAEVMSEVGYDAGTLGNHDFQWGVPGLEQRLEHARFPTVIANVVREDGSRIPRTEPHRIFDLNGVKVGVVGLLTTETVHSQRTDRLEGVKFLDEVETLKASVEALRKDGADAVVVLSHMGLEKDEEVAREFPGAGLVFLGGHNHDRLAKPVEVAGNYIVQAGSQGKELGEVTLEVDLGRRSLASVSHRLVPVDPTTVPPDPKVAALVSKYQTRAQEEMGHPLVTLPDRLTRSNHTDSPVGNMVTDAMRQATGAQVALMNSDGLRTDLEAGPVSMKTLYELMPFGGEVMQGTLTGTQLLQALEHSIEQRQTEPGVQSPFLQVSGMRVAYDAALPSGERLLEVEVAGKPLDPEASYTVALEDYLSAGKLGYESFKDGGWQTSGVLVVTAIRDALAGVKTLGAAGFEMPRIEDRTAR